MQNKNIAEKIHVNLSNPKFQTEINQKECLKIQGCYCSVCKNKTNRKGQIFEPREKEENNFDQFIKQFPSIFPLTINPITTYTPEKGYHTHYYNGNRLDNKLLIFKTKVSKLLSNHPMASNIQIYGTNFSKITAKHQVLAFLRKLQQKSIISSKKIQNSQTMTKSLIFPSVSDQALLPRRNPQERQQNISTALSTKFKHGKVLYIQAYSHQIPIKVCYEKDLFLKKFDNILIEYLDDEVENFHSQKVYNINEEFWTWVYAEYGEQVFAYFVTEFYCRAYEFFSKNKIVNAVFFWIFQKPKSQFGQNTKVTEQLGKHKQILEAQYFISKAKKLGFKVKLGNIKNMTIEYHRSFKTFQQEYQEIILSKINTKIQDKSTNKLSGGKKSYVYQNRLDSFHSKVRYLFLNEQNKVLNQVESEKEHEGVVDSNKLARLLLPNMGEEQTIRQILNDQQAFQKLILFQEKKIERERLRKARQNLLIEKKQTARQKHNFDQSRLRNPLSPSKRIRVRTQY